ncbi:PepSY-associated TM helix domain-containing protein [Methylobacterium sp. SyP6R]|uniref:PepSY-associated TM helix domain-containing protein n=1 Tax=Methylobacterium sp. SyP6R TaxID=2718876 RepID=UPI001F42E5EB|nr:PepSY-associated TM helix domain-containing protein [Methylobacterium sp. SyP6R]MCF4127331.1 PepSY domain-containing protein [Methylobacterium sp. SyP6R]
MPVRNALFQLHWFLGLTAGLVLMLVGVTGGILSVEDEVTGLMSPGIVTVPAREGPRLTPDALVTRLKDEAPGRRVTLMVLNGAPDRAARVRLADGPGRGTETYVDPYDGRVLGPARGEEVFDTVRRLHRWLLLPGNGDGWGRTLTGASALALVYLALSGLYLRWPKGRRDWRIWLKPALNRRGRALYWSLHAVVGTWMLVLYLMMALTGLWWSYGWYRDGATFLLTGRSTAAAPARGKEPREMGKRDGAPVPLDPAFAAFATATNGRYATASLAPTREGETIRIRAVAADASHFQARDEWRFHPDGSPVSRDLYAERALGARLTGSMLALHEGKFFGPVGWIAFMLAALAMPLFGVTGLLLYLGRRRSRRRHAAAAVQTA